MEQKPVFNESDLKDHNGIWLWIENPEGEILMQYHKKFGFWTIPIEKSDLEETLDDAIKRTGFEELGININDYYVIRTETDGYKRNGIHVTVNSSLVKVYTYDGIPSNMEPEKHTDFGWKSKDFIVALEDTTDAVKTLQYYL